MAVAFRFPSVLAPRFDESRPRLTVVPKEERRYVVLAVAVATLLVAMGMVVALRAHMAQQQMKIDKLNYDISRAREHFDSLRADRASLQSPEVLTNKAHQIGMVPSLGTTIVNVPAGIAAEVAATVGKVDSDVIAATESPLDEFGRLKKTVVGAP
jgi:cell division protein FtsL